MKWIASFLTMIALAGCADSSDHLDRRVKELEAESNRLSVRLDQTIDSINQYIIGEAVELTPDTKEFGHLTDGAVNLTVSLNGFKQRGSATDVSLRFGNLTSATLVECGASVSVRRSKEGGFTPLGYKKIDKRLAPGQWNDVTISLADSQADEISAIAIDVPTCNKITLFTN